MKSCPTCQADYPHAANFCGADGALLTSETHAGSGAAAENSPGLEERLEKLRELYTMGLLNEFDYAYHRQKIIAEG